MAKALKLMTWNVQMLPDIVAVSDLDIKERAKRMARQILDLPTREQPDIVAFNEVFNETGRDSLKRYLKSTYPYIIEKLEHPGIDLEEDSGLMLVSKLPFQTLPTGGEFFFEPFKKAAGWDKYAAKGVGVVRVLMPFDPTTIVFTHLQASDNSANPERMEMDIREDQLRMIREVLLKLKASDNSYHAYTHTVITGDLNVKGDPDDTSGEFNQVFSAAPDTFSEDFDDGWRAVMHAPNDLTDYDPGYTQRDTETLLPNRYDYQCVWRNPNSEYGLVPHHLSTPIRLASEITDHWALLGHLHGTNQNCSPSSAVDLLSLPPINPNQPVSQVWILAASFRDEDMYHWLYIKDAGTYSAWCFPSLEVAAYRRSDFTNELEPTDILSVNDLPPGIQREFTDRAQFNKGFIFSSREAFFLRFRGTSSSFKGTGGYGIIRHRGESKETAIVLHPHLAIDPDLPKGQKLGLDDKCFFRADRPHRFSEKPYEDDFVLSNPTQVNITLGLEDDYAQKLQPTVAGNGVTVKMVRTGAMERVYIVLRRLNVNDTKFLMTWDSPLSFLVLDESFRLHVDDETGPDWAGADELELSVDVDGVNVYANSWDDADAGEDWPGLIDSVKSSVLAKQGKHSKWVAFTDSISFDVIKSDGIFAHGSAVGFIKALKPRDRVKETGVAVIKISDPAGDGYLTAHGTLGKFPLL